MQVSLEDVERAGQIVGLISEPHPVIAAPASNPFYVEEFWRAVAHALNRPFRVVLVEEDRPYNLLGKADPDDGRGAEGKLTYCARRGYVIVLLGEATEREKLERKIPEGIRWLAEATDGFTVFPAGWTAEAASHGAHGPAGGRPGVPGPREGHHRAHLDDLKASCLRIYGDPAVAVGHLEGGRR